MSGNSIPVILVGTAIVTAAVAARLEWIRRQMGVPLPAPSAGRAMRRFWRAVRRMPRRRHHEME